MKRLLLVALLAISFSADAVVIRGDVKDAKYRVPASEFPGLVDMPGEGQGVLIAPRWVVTAAHAAPMQMQGMEEDVTIGGAARKVKRVITYLGYKRLPENLVKQALASGDISKVWAFLASSNDIALIELASPVKDVTPVPLYRGNTEVGMTVELVGKGATGNGAVGMYPHSPHRGVLRRAFNVIVGADARYVWYRFDQPPAALPLEGITGSGDSGGPLLVGKGSSKRLVGLASWSKYPPGHPFLKNWKPGRPFVEGLYGETAYAVRISRYIYWIEGVMATHAQARAPSASGPGNTADTSSWTAPQKPFHMPASERKNIAGNPPWTAPQKPFRIYGNTWYVGPHGLGVFLITAPTGDVLIDGGVYGDAPLIEANIRDLGVNLRDIKWILNSHAHSDHAGGIAQLAYDTGAQVIAGTADAPLLERGGHDDPEYGDRFSFPPVHVSRMVTDGEHLHLGDLVLTAHATPGHTKGNTTWTWMSCEGKRCLHMVDVGSLSAPGFKSIGNPKYPKIVRDFEHSFGVVAALRCDVPLAPHPGMVNFWARVAKHKQDGVNALIDPMGCRAYATYARHSFAAELAKQRAEASARQERSKIQGARAATSAYRGR